ncbi:MAG: RNA methyltransferase [Syntrophobacteraceae bacterium]
MPPLYLALVHHPVLNRRGEEIASAVTNLDLHDFARLSCTYSIAACFIATPLVDQRALVEVLISHWSNGVAKELHADREQALRRLRLVDGVRAAMAEIETECGRQPLVWATSARKPREMLPVRAAREGMLSDSVTPRLILFGTGWGLAPSVFDCVDAVLEPIEGSSGYNHLSVRCAAAILVDRLLHMDR